MTGPRLRRLLVAAAVVAVGAASAWAAVQPPATITTVAGSGAAGVGPGVDGEAATAAPVDHPRGVSLSPRGGFLVAEPFRNTVRWIDAQGRMVRVAGTGEPGYSGDGGPAVQARLDLVHATVSLPDGGFVVADTGNNRIRRVWPDGTITTVAGTGEAGFSGDGGPASEARIFAPRSVSVLRDGALLIPDSGNHRIRRVWPDGTITTVAGTGEPGFSGDGGPATAAELNQPFAVAPLRHGGFLVADAANHRIRRVGADGTISTVAGTGVAGFSGDGGPALSAALDSPHAVASLPDGGFLVADTLNHRVRRVWPNGTIGTVAGTGTAGYSGDGGAAATAALDLPKALAVLDDLSGFLIGDAANNRVRLVRANLRPPLALRVTTRHLRSKFGHPALLQYTLSDAATTRLSVLRGPTVVLRATRRCGRGSNRLSFGTGLPPGAYALRLVATTADGRSASATTSLRVVH